MKHKKTIVAICVLLALVLPYWGIVQANDAIAKGLEDILLAHPLPAQTELIESTAIAGKKEGNGNGMQYFGILLLKSGLSEEELQLHYDGLYDGDQIPMVFAQQTDEIFEYSGLRFAEYPGGEDCYQVRLCAYSTVGFEETFWEELLNCDIRGH